MRKSFKNIVIGYTATLFLLICIGCICVWNGLEKFQHNYEIQQIVDSTQKKVNTILVPENITLSDQHNTPSVAETPEGMDIIANSDMVIMLDGNVIMPEVIEQVENQLFEDYSERTGRQLVQCVYYIPADDLSRIQVADSKGALIEPVGNDYSGGIHITDEAISSTAIRLFEQYLRHISKMITLDELQAVMCTDSKAYKAVKNSQKSLEWMIAAKEMVFSKQEVKNMMFLDDHHMICDLHMDLSKRTENNRTVNESVNYRVLYEKISNQWYIYSFSIIDE